MKHLADSQKLRTIGLVIAGNAIYSLAVVMFILPCGLISGGTTGLALIGQHFWGIPVSSFVLVSNIIMFCLGALIMGRWFAFNTALSTFCYPIFLHLFGCIPGIDSMTKDPMLATICAGVMVGVGIGLIIGAGASSGGMDIPPIIANKFWGVPVSVGMYGLDFLILVVQMSFARNREQILYGILLVLLYTTVLDRMVLVGQSRVQVKIISKQSEQIRSIILQMLDRGCTLLHAQTGYAKEETDVILTITTNRELAKLNQLVQQADPDAFIIIDSVSQVHGRGFTLKKSYQ